MYTGFSYTGQSDAGAAGRGMWRFRRNGSDRWRRWGRRWWKLSGQYHLHDRQHVLAFQPHGGPEYARHVDQQFKRPS